ncbi:MAG: hypothetical protein Q8936_17950 [Bacillota bacterium]|nr:hypothetical protein [Bacillota bacterium]
MNRKINKKMLLILCCFLIHILLWSSCINAHAAETVPLNDVELWKTDKVEAKYEVMNKNDINFEFNTNGNEKDYYSFGAFDIMGLRDLSDFNGIWITVKCNMNQRISMQFTMNDKNRNQLSYKKDYGTLRQEGNQLVVSKVDSGNISLNNKDNYRIFIPFDEGNLQPSGIDFRNISTFGFAFTVQGKTMGTISLSDIQFVNKNEGEKYIQKFQNSITGDKIVYIPTYSEINVPYRVVGNNNNFQFESSNTDGLSITKEGILAVGEKAKEQELRLRAISNDGTVLEYKVNLVGSWTKKVSGAPQIPSEDKYKGDILAYREIRDGQVVNVVRISIIVLGVLFLAVYKWQRAKYAKVK